jgi:hypothetical protein
MRMAGFSEPAWRRTDRVLVCQYADGCLQYPKTNCSSISSLIACSCLLFVALCCSCLFCCSCLLLPALACSCLLLPALVCSSALVCSCLLCFLLHPNGCHHFGAACVELTSSFALSASHNFYTSRFCTPSEHTGSCHLTVGPSGQQAYRKIVSPDCHPTRFCTPSEHTGSCHFVVVGPAGQQAFRKIVSPRLHFPRGSAPPMSTSAAVSRQSVHPVSWIGFSQFLHIAVLHPQ